MKELIFRWIYCRKRLHGPSFGSFRAVHWDKELKKESIYVFIQEVVCLQGLRWRISVN